jgi:hypothetical protein
MLPRRASPTGPNIQYGILRKWAVCTSWNCARPISFHADVDLMCPDRPDVVERKSKIQEKEYARAHDPILHPMVQTKGVAIPPPGFSA